MECCMELRLYCKIWEGSQWVVEQWEHFSQFLLMPGTCPVSLELIWATHTNPLSQHYHHISSHLTRLSSRLDHQRISTEYQPSLLVRRVTFSGHRSLRSVLGGGLSVTDSHIVSCTVHSPAVQCTLCTSTIIASPSLPPRLNRKTPSH